eukprot:9214-Eustigmatos_ZCMA.PRE.1
MAVTSANGVSEEHPDGRGDKSGESVLHPVTALRSLWKTQASLAPMLLLVSEATEDALHEVDVQGLHVERD